jgi:hypothetical protein
VETFTPVSSLLGGALIGLAASVLLLFHGRVAGIAGILGETLRGDGTRGESVFRAAFLVGLVAAGLTLRLVYPAAFSAAGSSSVTRIALVAVAGLLVGYGTRASAAAARAVTACAGSVACRSARSRRR